MTAVTVVVATHGRARLLPRLVDALAVQDGVDFEVVIVDDASTDDTDATLAALAGSAPFPLTALRQDRRRGPAAARNRGWRAGSGEVVAFTDDDCVPQPGWLATLAAGVSDGTDIAQGRTVPIPEQLDDHGPFGRTMRVPQEEGYYETCNIAYHRSWLERLGGFDESYDRPYGEDIDLAWRAREAGATTTFVPDALVHHEVFASDWRAAVRDARRVDGLHRALRRHPGLRAHLGKRIFHRPTHPAALLAGVGGIAVLVRPRSPWAWLLAAGLGGRYAVIVRRTRPRPPHKWQWLGVVPAAWVVDVHETAQFAKASVKHRVLLL